MDSIACMVRTALVAASVGGFAGTAWADGDRAEALRLQAQQKARAEAAQRQATEHRAKVAKAEIETQRKLLGKPAEGKSDAEVKAMWDRRNADARAQGAAVQAAMSGMVAKSQAQQQRLNDPKARADADAGARMMGARSMQDLMNMSEDELKKLQADFEKKHGKS